VKREELPRCRAGDCCTWAILLENMRREGYELSVGKPGALLTKEVNGRG